MHDYVGFSQMGISRVKVRNPCDVGYESWSQKTIVCGLPVGENCMILGSLVLTHY